MSLIVSNRATDKQIEMLKKLEYHGDLNLSVEEAAELIDEYIEYQQDMQSEMEGYRYDIY